VAAATAAGSSEITVTWSSLTTPLGPPASAEAAAPDHFRMPLSRGRLDRDWSAAAVSELGLTRALLPEAEAAGGLFRFGLGALGGATGSAWPTDDTPPLPLRACGAATPGFPGTGKKLHRPPAPPCLKPRVQPAVRSQPSGRSEQWPPNPPCLKPREQRGLRSQSPMSGKPATGREKSRARALR